LRNPKGAESMSDTSEKNDRAENPVDNPVTMPGRNGGTLKRGGNNGGGRPPDEFRARMRELATREETEAYLQRCLAGEFGPKPYQRALQYVTDHGYGKAVQPISGEGGGPLEVTVIRKVMTVADDQA
jgi:hypothetical protein